MARKIIIIEHHDEPRDDLASMFLPKLGFTLEYFRPFAGQSLPDVEEDTAGIIITGGAANVDEMNQYPHLREEARWIEYCLEKDILPWACVMPSLPTSSVAWSPHDGGRNSGYTRLAPMTNIVRTIFSQCNFTAGFEVPKDAEQLAAGDIFPNQAFRYGDNVTWHAVSSGMYTRHTETLAGAGRRSLAAAGVQGERRNKTGWPPATSIMSSTGSRSCSEIFLHLEQIMRTEYSRSRWSIHHVVT